jgi:hypothetical protein
MSRSYSISRLPLNASMACCETALLYCWLCWGGAGSDRGIGVELDCYLIVTRYNFKRLAS